MKMLSIHPGTWLKSQYLTPRSLTIDDLSVMTGFDSTFLSKFLDEEERITSPLANSLSTCFPDSSVAMWMNLQIACDKLMCIEIGDMLVPKPIRVEPIRGQCYWLAGTSEEPKRQYWSGTPKEMYWLKSGLMQRTKDGAYAQIKATHLLTAIK